MFAMVIAFFVVVLSFNFFAISYQVTGVNRLVLGAPLSLFETAIDMYGIDYNKGPHFNKEMLENNITSYFSFHMPRYTDDYSLSYYYYNTTDHSLDMSNEVKAVEVSVTANLVLFYQYQKTMYYEIRSQ